MTEGFIKCSLLIRNRANHSGFFISVFNFIIYYFVCFNNIIYLSEFYGPTKPEASKTQAFTSLRANVESHEIHEVINK